MMSKIGLTVLLAAMAAFVAILGISEYDHGKYEEVAVKMLRFFVGLGIVAAFVACIAAIVAIWI